MRADNHSGIGEIDVGNPQMDDGHHQLARLIEKVGSVCCNSLDSDCGCDDCPGKDPKACFDSLVEIGREIMVRMIDHFHHEDELMKSLPHIQSTREHCLAHRQEHVNFTTRYNRTVSHINARQPVIGLKAFQAFIIDWIRSHILEFDSKLGALLKAHSSNC